MHTCHNLLCACRGYVLYLTVKVSFLEGRSSTDVYQVRDVPVPWSHAYLGVLLSTSEWHAPSQVAEVPLKAAQTAAVLEVVHSAAGLVKSPVAITGVWRCL